MHDIKNKKKSNRVHCRDNMEFFANFYSRQIDEILGRILAEKTTALFRTKNIFVRKRTIHAIAKMSDEKKKNYEKNSHTKNTARA